MQTRAILEAAAEAAKKTGEAVAPEIMIPLVGMKSELEFVKGTINATSEEGKPRDYDIDRTSSLSPVPGLAGVMR